MCIRDRHLTTQQLPGGNRGHDGQQRHPTALAQQALTAAAQARGRFTLGIGLSHKVVIEGALGLSYAQPAKTMREYLDILCPMLAGEPAKAKGELYRSVWSADVSDAAKPVPLLLAALGPQMLQLAGSRSDGTILWMTGARTIAEHVRPTIDRAATAAGRPASRVIAGFPVVLTDDEAGGREAVGKQLAVYGQLPSYRAMLDREGVAGPAELALVGNEARLDAALSAIADAGADDLIAVLVETDEGARARTLDFLQSRL